MKNDSYLWGEELTSFAPRIPGTTNMDRSRDYIVKKLKGFGIEAKLEPVNFRGVFHQNWSLDVISPSKQSITCYPENNVGFGDVEADIVDVGNGDIADYEGLDVTGKIVLVNWGDLEKHELSCGMGKRYPLLQLYDNAWENKAAGMIGYFTDTPGNSLKLLEPGIKTSGGSNISGPAEAGDNNGLLLPAVNIGRHDALKIKDELKKQTVSVKLTISGKRKVSTVWTITGTLPGKTSNSILLGSHYCTAFSGAICDTVGVVGTLRMAEHFSRMPLEKRPKTIHFIFSGNHVWQNCNIASLTYIERHKDVIPDITAMLWLDHISGPPKPGNEKKDKKPSHHFVTPERKRDLSVEKEKNTKT